MSPRAPVVLMLEDDAERVDRFTHTLQSLAPTAHLIVWRDAWKMIAELEAVLHTADLVALDHDLEPDIQTSVDPGDGLDLARWLANRSPICPVIVHTSNGGRGDAMVGEFEFAGWEYYRVMPLGDDWIEVDWRRVVRKLLARHS